MIDKENTVEDPETGKRVILKEYVYEYEKQLENTYRQSLLKAFKKTVDDGFYPMIIVDTVNESVSQFEDFYNYALKKQFAVYVCEMESSDPRECFRRNIHNRSLEDIQALAAAWEPTPKNTIKLDIRSFLQDTSIQEVEMEAEEKKELETPSSGSRWEKMEEASDECLDRLDAYVMRKKEDEDTIEKFLEENRTEDTESGSKGKRVRWADLEAIKRQARARDVGFVVGQNWEVPNPAQLLTHTKYFS
jgi:YLP motif-containing protein 1